jgi:SAM-dependent methyltransferase
MIDDVSDIEAMYSNDLEREHLRLERHQLEYDITWRYLNKYLPPEGCILEIGAATGRYTLELAKQVRLIAADARDLNEIEKNAFDAVLLMGPLYHLVEEEDRKMAVKEAFDRLRENGVIISSFISRFGILGDLLKKMPEWIERQAEVRSVIDRGRDPEDLPRQGFRGYFANVSEIAPLHKDVGFETVVVAGVEPAISADDESYNRLKGKQRKLWLDLLYEASTEATIIGASRHLLYVGKKRNK